MAVSQTVGNDAIAGYAAGLLGNICFDLGEYDATRKYHQVSLTIREKLGAVWETGMLSISMGIHDMELGNLEDAEQKMKTAVECMERVKSAYGLGVTYSWLGKLKAEQGDYQAARSIFAENLESCRASNLDSVYAGFLQRFAWLEILEEKWEDAERQLFEAIHLFYRLNARRYVNHCLEDYMIYKARRGSSWESIVLAAYTDKTRESEATIRHPQSQKYFDEAITHATSSLTALEVQSAIRQGKDAELGELLHAIGLEFG